MRFEVSSIKDLPETHRMGHTCANLKGDLFFIWGGTNENTAFLSSRNNHLWIYETLTGYWRHRSCSGECPPNLSGATSALIGRKMYIFGGHSSARENWLNSVYCLDLESFTWRDLGPLSKGEPSKPIKCDKCVSWSFNGNLYVFGGYGSSQVEHLSQLMDLQRDLQLAPDQRWPRFGWNNQLVEFKPSDNTWRWPSYSGKCPSARAAHSGALVGESYYLFGGRDSCQRLNDLYSLNMKSMEWLQIRSFSPHSQPERPIGHLLESSQSESEESADEQSELDNNLNQQQLYEELHQEGMDMVREEEALEEDQSRPSPSSSMNYNWSAGNEFAPAYDIDDDDDDDQHFQFPLPSQLLERWSLSSSNSAQQSGPSRSSNSNHLEDCQGNPAGVGRANISNEASRPAESSDQQNNALAHETSQDRRPSGDGATDSIVSSGEDPAGDRELAIPIGRSFGSFTQISDQDIILYGGISSQDEVLNDCWLFNLKHNTWTQIDLKTKQSYPRLWHTGSRTKNNELIIVGGSNTSKIDDFCTDVLTISLEPKSLKRTALDAIARSIKMRTINRVQGLPSTVGKLIKLRKQAMALTTIRRNNSRLPAA